MTLRQKILFLTSWLNRLSLLLGFIIGMGYNYLAVPGLCGLVLGFLTASANLALMWITSDNALNQPSITANSTFYTGLGMIANVLSSCSVFIHTYYSIMLLAPLLPVASGIMFGISILIAACCTLSNFLFAVIQLFRDRQTLPPGLRESTLTFSNFTNCLHTLVTLGHIWATDAHAGTFCWGVFLSLCDLVVLYIFNHQLLSAPSSMRAPHTSNTFWDTIKGNAYIGLSMICIIGSKIGSAIVYYQGTLLLGLALKLPFTFVLTMAVSTTVIATFAGLLFSASQAYDLYQKIFPAMVSIETEDDQVVPPSLTPAQG
jgi:hypothetical protein